MRRISILATLVALAASAVVVLGATASGKTQSRPPGSGATESSISPVITDVMAARLATAKYATNLNRAKADGYGILTKMIPTMGYHFINPKVKTFNIRKPPILVYEHHGNTWQLGALEWVFTSTPAKPPLPGARYGVFGAACHYLDGTVVFANAQSMCAPKSKTGAAFNFWHPRLITLHMWIWYPNPSGLYSGTNPMVTPFNNG
jgi:hypothetical protein